jgi:hypothetical protein
MSKRITKLTAAQEAAMTQHAEHWIQRGLDTLPPDWDEVDRGIRECYAFANLQEPKVIVRVPNPLVGALAFPIASYLLASGAGISRRRDAVDGVVGGAVRGAVGGAVGGAVRGAVGGAVDDAVGGAVGGAVRGAVGGAVDDAVDGAVRGAVGGAVDDAVGDAVDGVVGGAVDGVVGGAVRGVVGGAVRGAVRGAVGDAVGDAVDGAVRGAVDDAVGDAVDGAVRGAVRGAVGDAVRGAVGGVVDDAVGGAVDDAVGGVVRGAENRQLRQTILNLCRRAFDGQHWTGGWYWGLPYTTFFRDHCGLELEGDLWDRSRAWERANTVGWWWPHKQFVMVCERPRFVRREQVRPRGWGSHRLHCEDGPAIEWDGWELYFWHGLQVPAEAFTQPGWLDAERITRESNAELRRAYMEIYGQGRYIREAGGELIDEVHEPPFPGLIDARLWRLPNPDGGEEMVCVECRNSTREPDGSYKIYSLWVHPELRPLLDDGRLGEPQELTAHNALASTYGERGNTYAPAVET